MSTAVLMPLFCTILPRGIKVSTKMRIFLYILGVRVRVGNTDAEGRMAMADVLCYMKERALKEVGGETRSRFRFPR